MSGSYEFTLETVRGLSEGRLRVDPDAARCRARCESLGLDPEWRIPKPVAPIARETLISLESDWKKKKRDAWEMPVATGHSQRLKKSP